MRKKVAIIYEHVLTYRSHYALPTIFSSQNCHCEEARRSNLLSSSSLPFKPKLSLRGGTTKQSAKFKQSAYCLITTAKIGQIASLAALVRNDSFCLKKYCGYVFRKQTLESHRFFKVKCNFERQNRKNTEGSFFDK